MLVPYEETTLKPTGKQELNPRNLVAVAKICAAILRREEHKEREARRAQKAVNQS